ncbi:leucine rich repeat containing 7 [Willisornis vidua]|uniref:Leucine rich repeat containing 7 n=1 Tax=Willisornis vidua TaxID=1566151 RepID=A0ABQ9DDU7_9PASS|nr:leucine rich repeat containing 7 [Willisornis vidua]
MEQPWEKQKEGMERGISSGIDGLGSSELNGATLCQEPSCQALRKLSIPDNDLSSLPPGIASLGNLRELDISKNGIQDFPENIKCCKCLTIIEASVNPVSKLVKLRILELRENHLKTLPKSMHKLTQLERLDLGNNEFSELSIGKLKQLVYLDVSKNRIETVDLDISGCEGLEDLLLSSNMLQQLPDSIGLLKRLTTLKVDDNQLTILPNAIGKHLRGAGGVCGAEKGQQEQGGKAKECHSWVGSADVAEEFLDPDEFYESFSRYFFRIFEDRCIGSCKNVTVMSLRSNKLEFLPDEIGQMQKLRVLNLSDNRLKNLPFTFTKLKELAALWLSDNQSKALIPLQTEAHPETKQRVLTNYMFPQQPRSDEDFQSDSDSFNPTLWEEQRQQRMTVAFEFEDKKEEEENPGKVKVEINLKRYPTPYPEDLKNMVKSVQNLVAKPGHGARPEGTVPATPSDAGTKDKYEHKWPLAPKEISVEGQDKENTELPKSPLSETESPEESPVEAPDREEKAKGSEDAFGHPASEMRIGELRPSLPETPLYPPKLVLLGKDKKESTDESEADKLHCLNNSVSSGTYSDYSPSQASSGSSNAHVKMGSLQTTAKEAVNNSLWGNRLAQSFPQPLETKPLLSQRDSAPVGNVPARPERRPLSDTFAEGWPDGSHYDNTGFVGEESAGETPNANPLLSTKSRSSSAHGRRPLIRQDRIVGIPLELEQPTLRNTHESEVPPPNPWQNWTRTPSPFEDRTAFPSKLESTPTTSPLPERKDHIKESPEMTSTFPPGIAWEYHDSNANRSLTNVFSHLHCRPDPSKNIISISKSTERLSPMMRDLKTNKFKKSQSIDEIDIGAYKVYNIPLENYASGNDTVGPHERVDKLLGAEHGMLSMSRSQSVPMLDDELLTYGSVKVQPQQRPPVTKKVYQFDQSFNPQGAVELTADKRLLPPFQLSPEYLAQPKALPQELVSPRGYRGYAEPSFSFPQAAAGEEPAGPPFGSQGTRPAFLRRADSLVGSAEMAAFRRAGEPPELPAADRYGRATFRAPGERQPAMAVPDAQFLKRNGRYEDELPSYQEVKAQTGSFPVKNLTQRRPLSARSYSTESYGASQTRPVSARPTMAALLEKIPSDYNLGNYGDKPSDSSDIKPRPPPGKGNESCAKMPADWRQQLLRHIEARRLDRTPSQQSGLLDNGQDEVPVGSPWNPYPLGRRDVPPDTVTKKPGSHIQTLMGSQSLQHRSREQPYEGGMNKVTIQQYQAPLPIQIPVAQTARAPQSGRCLIQTKGQRSSDAYPEQFCVRIEKNPGLGFSISGGISGQGNPFKPSDKGIFVTRVQPDGPAASLLQPGDKILQANGHSFVHMEHEKAVLLLKSFQNTVDLVIQRELTV